MYRAKATGGNRFEMFDPSMTVAVRQRLSVESDLRRAIDGGQFFLRYHPQIDLVSGKAVAAEALVRWNHPTRGEVMPGEFISLAEDTALIVPIGAWVLGEACRQAARWRVEFKDRAPLRMAVNVSPRQLGHPGFVALVRGALAESGTRACDLELEITESMLISDTGPAIDALQTLRRLGVGIAIDDFGTGYSSLSYLRRFPVDRLKLDMSFIAGLGRGDDSAKHGDGALVAAAINLAHALGVEAVAEGVENVQQLRTLVAFGCEQGQGYLWTKPLLADDVGAWLDRPRVNGQTM
jgi:EAL domain-containing protein (putative c-di-GMP-specific phosphodiesterase class I)